MRRRRFDHLVEEIAIHADDDVPRYRLYVAVAEWGAHPETLSASQCLAFVDEALPGFLADEGLVLSPRALRSLRRSVARHAPEHPSVEERFARI